MAESKLKEQHIFLFKPRFQVSHQEDKLLDRFANFVGSDYIQCISLALCHPRKWKDLQIVQSQ